MASESGSDPARTNRAAPPFALTIVPTSSGLNLSTVLALNVRRAEGSGGERERREGDRQDSGGGAHGSHCSLVATVAGADPGSQSVRGAKEPLTPLSTFEYRMCAIWYQP
jgi:hypothetical protein